MKIYSNLESYITKYCEKAHDALCYVLSGSLLDNYILTSSDKKIAIIKEHYLNEYSSGHTIRFYNQLPKKYEEVITLLDNEEEEKARKLFFA